MARRRRYRNPKVLPGFGEILPTLVMIGVAYWLYRQFAKTGADIGRGVSEAWNLFWIPPVTNVNSVRLPDGTTVTVDAIVKVGGIDKAGVFTWGGVTYQISGTDTQSGLYMAKRLVS